MNGTGGAAIEEVCGRVKGLHPKRRGEVGLEDEGTHDVICGAEESFGLAILRGGVRTRKTVGDAVGGQEGA